MTVTIWLARLTVFTPGALVTVRGRADLTGRVRGTRQRGRYTLIRVEFVDRTSGLFYPANLALASPR